MGARVVLVGLDGADGALVERWADAGTLPTLQHLRAVGLTGELVSPPGLGDDAAWGAFSTAVGPGRNGRFYHEQWRPGTDEVMPWRRDAMSGTAFWTALGEAGRRVGVIDVPKSPIGTGDQLVVADWMCHGPDGPEVVCYPPEFRAELDRRNTSRPGFICDKLRRDPTETTAFVDELCERSALRTDLVTDLLERDSWDLLLTVFAETHCVGHQHWHDHDPNHPEHDARAAAQTGDPIAQVYRRVDARLAEIIDAAGPESTIVAFSLLGMTANYSGAHLLDEILARIEYRTTWPSTAGVPSWARLRTRVPQWIRRIAPTPVRRAGARLRARELRARRFRALPVDLASSAIRLNVVGRDPHGVLWPGRDYGDTCRRLRDELLALEDPRTAERLVREIVLTHDRYPGEGQDNFADVLVIWNQDRPIVAAVSPLVGKVGGRPPRDRTGNHRPNGWFVAAGPGIAPSALRHPASILDLAPTVAGMLGVSLTDVEGSVIGALEPDRGKRRR